MHLHISRDSGISTGGNTGISWINTHYVKTRSAPFCINCLHLWDTNLSPVLHLHKWPIPIFQNKFHHMLLLIAEPLSQNASASWWNGAGWSVSLVKSFVWGENQGSLSFNNRVYRSFPVILGSVNHRNRDVGADVQWRESPSWLFGVLMI